MWGLLVVAFLPVYVLAAIIPARRNLLIFGSSSNIHCKYWSLAMHQAGFRTMTIMDGVQAFDKPDDFDRYFVDFAPAFIPRPLRVGLGSCLAFLFVLRKAAILHTTFFGFAVGMTWLWRLEPLLLKLARVRTVVVPFGADGYLHSRIIDTSLRYALLTSRGHRARYEVQTTRRVHYWMRHADVIIAGLMVDGIGRWDVTTNQPIAIDTEAWAPKKEYNDNDGHNGPVRLLHSPSSRGFKGTEFLLDAVSQLRNEGLQIELILLEGVPNEEVKNIMPTADILAEQFLATGYGTNGVEGLACGLPVMANLEHEAYTRVFRRFGFLDECPILSTTPETMAENIRILVENPGLRRRLGQASRAFAEKYHSFETAQYLFGSIYSKLVEGRDIDIMNLFHPLLSDFNKASPRIDHPLIDNKLPPQVRAELKRSSSTNA